VNRGTIGVNSLPKTVTRQRLDCDLNPGPSAPESSTLATRLSGHPSIYEYINDDSYTVCNRCGWQALAEAIQSVTEMNQDLAVEKIEIETATTDFEVNGPK